jgi:hypothetical protein
MMKNISATEYLYYRAGSSARVAALVGVKFTLTLLQRML